MKTQHQVTTANSHIWHCTRTAGSADVKGQNLFHVRNKITCSTNCITTLYPL